MTNKESLKDAYEKLECFDNPILHEIADQIKQAYRNLYEYDSSLNGIIAEVAEARGYSLQQIINGRRKKELVYTRYLIATKAKQEGFGPSEIARALDVNHSTVHHYLNDYTPPKK